MSTLIENSASLQDILDTVNSLPDKETINLPTLTNPAAATDILSGKEAIDGSGNKITGTLVQNNGINEWQSGASYNEGDIVIFNDIYYICILTHSEYPSSPDNDNERWKKVNETNEDTNAISLVTLPAKTYVLKSNSPYNSNYSVHPYNYSIVESIACTYTKGEVGGMYSRIRLTGVGRNNCPDNPFTGVIFYDSSGE